MPNSSAKPQTSTTLEWMDLRALQEYAAVSERTLREWVHRAINPLPASRVGHKILIRRTTFDGWVASHPLQPAESIDITATVDEIINDLGGR